MGSLILVFMPERKSRDSAISESSFEEQIVGLLVAARSFNPLDEMEIQADGCRISWRREFVSRQCVSGETIHSRTTLINLETLRFARRDSSTHRINFHDKSNPVGQMNIRDLKIPKRTSGIEDVLEIYKQFEGQNLVIVDNCQGDGFLTEDETFYSVSLYGEDADKFESLVEDYAAANSCW